MKGRRYDSYNFEEAYNVQLERLAEAEQERRMSANQCNRLYRTKTTTAGKMVEVDIYPVFADKAQAPRGEKKKRSRPAQLNLNDRRAKRYLNNLISANFGEGDLWGTFEYDADHLPESPEDAQKKMQGFIRKVNRIRKKRGQDNLRYIYVTEYADGPEKKIRVHHHMIFSGDCDRDEIEALWKYGKRTKTERLAPDKDTHLAGLAMYIMKDPHGRKRWSASRGLKKPKETKSYTKFRKRKVEHMAKDRVFLEEEIRKQYPGCRFVDAEVRVSAVADGFYIYARMVRD